MLLYSNLWCYHYLWWFKVVVICTGLGLYINLYTLLLLMVDIIIEGIPYRYVASQSGDVVNRLERLFVLVDSVLSVSWNAWYLSSSSSSSSSSIYLYIGDVVLRIGSFTG